MTTIIKKCSKCGKDKPLEAFPIRNDRPSGRQSRCKECGNEYNRTHKAEYQAWCDINRDRLNEHIRDYNHRTGRSKPMSEDKTSPVYLGVYVAERVLSKYFNRVERMPYGNVGYDFICDKGYKIDAKCSCLVERTFLGKYTYQAWRFNIKRNKIADCFLLLGMDDRDSLNPIKVWLIPGEDINSMSGMTITNSPKVVAKWAKYERSIDRVIECCNKLKSEANVCVQ